MNQACLPKGQKPATRRSGRLFGRSRGRFRTEVFATCITCAASPKRRARSTAAGAWSARFLPRRAQKTRTSGCALSRRSSPFGFPQPEIPRFTCRPVHAERERRRGSAKDRGYDRDWDRLSKWHASREPLCRECYFRGRHRPWELTNHVIPLRDRPDLRLDAKNLSSSCKSCHDSVIRELEGIARRMGDISLMVDWLSDPSTRPVRYRYTAAAFPRILIERSDADRSPSSQRRRKAPPRHS